MDLDVHEALHRSAHDKYHRCGAPQQKCKIRPTLNRLRVFYKGEKPQPVVSINPLLHNVSLSFETVSPRLYQELRDAPNVRWTCSVLGQLSSAMLRSFL